MIRRRSIRSRAPRVSTRFNEVSWAVPFVIGGIFALANWFIELPVPDKVVMALIFSAILALPLSKLIYSLRERSRRVREYQQALLDFRWH